MSLRDQFTNALILKAKSEHHHPKPNQPQTPLKTLQKIHMGEGVG